MLTKLQYENVFTTNWNKNMYARVYNPETNQSTVEYFHNDDKSTLPTKYTNPTHIKNKIRLLKMEMAKNPSNIDNISKTIAILNDLEFREIK